MAALARRARRSSAGSRTNGYRSVEAPVAASVASGWYSTELASTEAKSIGNVVWYSSSISVRTSTAGRPRSRPERRIKVLA
jgi:hypothetical protein